MLGEEPLDDLARLAEPPDALARRVERDAHAFVLVLIPARADPQIQPAVGDDVDRRGHVGMHGGMAVGVAGDHLAKAQALGLRRKGREQRPALQAGAIEIALDRREMVEKPGVLEGRRRVGVLPDLQHRVVGGVLRRGLDPHEAWPCVRLLMLEFPGEPAWLVIVAVIIDGCDRAERSLTGGQSVGAAYSVGAMSPLPIEVVVLSGELNRDGERRAAPLGEVVVGRSVLLDQQFAGTPVLGRVRSEDTGNPGVRLAAQLDCDPRVRLEIAHPVGPVAAAGEQVDRPVLHREPDLDAVRLAGAPPDRGQIRERLAGRLLQRFPRVKRASVTNAPSYAGTWPGAVIALIASRAPRRQQRRAYDIGRSLLQGQLHGKISL